MTREVAQRWVLLRRAELAVRLLLTGGLLVLVAGLGSQGWGQLASTSVLAQVQGAVTQPALAVALALIVVAPVLLVVAPLTGCTAVATFAAVALLVDDQPVVRAGASAMAAVAVLGAVVLVVVRGAQRRLVLAAVDGRSQMLPRVDRRPFADAGLGRQALAVLLVIAAVGGAARGLAEGGDGIVPQDLAWVPASVAACLLGAALLARSVEAARTATRALLTVPAPALPVLCALDDGHALLAVGDTVLARVPVVEVPVGEPSAGAGAGGAGRPRRVGPSPRSSEPSDGTQAVADAVARRREQELTAQLAQAWQTDTPPPGPWREAVAVGDLRIGGYVAVLLDASVLLPRGAVRAWAQRTDEVPPPDASERPLPGVPVKMTAPAGPSEPLPDPGEVVLPPSRRRRLEGAGLLALAVAAIGLAAVPGQDGLIDEVIVFAGAWALLEGWLRVAGIVVARRDAVVVPTAWQTVTVPWEQLHGVRRDGDRLALAWEAEQAMVGPFAGDEGTEAAARSAGVLLATLHQRAGAGVSPGADPAVPPVQQRVAPAVRALAVYAPLAVAALVIG
jgi:hypothetical protein